MGRGVKTGTTIKDTWTKSRGGWRQGKKWVRLGWGGGWGENADNGN